MKKRINNSNKFYDHDIFSTIAVEDLWIFDKLLVCKKLGYICGPKGIDVPSPGSYVIRPCINLMGMGRGAYITKLKESSDDIDNGSFWCEMFTGSHYNVDYYRGEQRLCVKGVKHTHENLSRWRIWHKANKQIPFPKDIIDQLTHEYDWVNVEFIEDKIVEIHLRRNPDFNGHNSDYVIPMYEDREYTILDHQRAVRAPDGDRTGFIIQK